MTDERWDLSERSASDLSLTGGSQSLADLSDQSHFLLVHPAVESQTTGPLKYTFC